MGAASNFSSESAVSQLCVSLRGLLVSLQAALVQRWSQLDPGARQGVKQATLTALSSQVRTCSHRSSWQPLGAPALKPIQEDSCAGSLKICMPRQCVHMHAGGTSTTQVCRQNSPSDGHGVLSILHRWPKRVPVCCQLQAAVAGHTAAQVIAKVAAIELPNKAWPELIATLLSMSQQAANPKQKQATLEAFGFICEEMCSIEGDVLDQEQVRALSASADTPCATGR